MQRLHFQSDRSLFLVVGLKANCPLVGPGPIGKMPSVGVESF